MKRYRINLETMTDVHDFVNIAIQFPKDVLRVADEDGHEVSAQSMLGMLYSLEWNSMYLYSKDETEPVYDAFAEFVIDG